MSTRSSIAILNKDGSVDTVYCHFDGYPEGVGKVLTEYYNNTEDVEHIIELGDISHIEAKLDPNPEYSHTFDTPQDEVTVFYGRDRGEENTRAKHWDNIQGWLDEASDYYSADFCYWWDGNEWHCAYTYDLGEIDLY